MSDKEENYDDDGTTICPEYTIWLCGACGKLSPTKHGFDKSNNQLNTGWDESCMLHAVLVHKPSIVRNDAGMITGASAVQVLDGKIVPDDSSPIIGA